MQLIKIQCTVCTLKISQCTEDHSVHWRFIVQSVHWRFILQSMHWRFIVMSVHWWPGYIVCTRICWSFQLLIVCLPCSIILGYWSWLWILPVIPNKGFPDSAESTACANNQVTGSDECCHGVISYFLWGMCPTTAKGCLKLQGCITWSGWLQSNTYDWWAKGLLLCILTSLSPSPWPVHVQYTPHQWPGWRPHSSHHHLWGPQTYSLSATEKTEEEM